MSKRLPVQLLLCSCVGLRLSLALYLPESKAAESHVDPLSLCWNAEDEFADWNRTELPRVKKTVYRRSPTVLYTSQLRARLLDEHTGSRGVLNMLQRIYRAELLPSDSMLQDSLSNIGDLRNLRRVMHKLIAGEPVTIVAIGGSVTIGHGPKELNASYVYRFFDWVNQTFPHPQHVFLNRALPAVTSAYVSPCVNGLVPENADLVLVEFTLNDTERGSRSLEDPVMRALERILRKLQRLPKNPAIILVHYWAARMEHGYAESAEDGINTLLKFYRLMGISMRDALHAPISKNASFIEGFYMAPSDTDHVHPSCIGSRFLAELLIGQFQDMIAAELLYPFRETSTTRAAVANLANDPLGAPLQTDNWGNLTETCVLNPDDMFKLVPAHQGFDWTDEGRRKWGFVGKTPGSVLEVEAPVADVHGEATIGLGFLISYAHMGIARLECVHGCECRPREYSFLHPYGNSQSGWRVVEARVQPAAASCRIRVTIMAQTYAEPAEHKVKLTSLMITEEKGFMMPWLFCDICAE